MFFDRFFRPKWQHKNANVRRQALLELPADDIETQAIFAQVAQNDSDPVVRQTVVRALFDTALLERIAQQDADATVREHAVQRLGSLLAGTVVGAPPADQRRAMAVKLEDRRILEYVARNGVDSALRWLAAERIDREALFADIAIADSDPQLRLDAASRVTQKSTMERILKQVRTKDKRVRAHVQDRLDALQAAAEKPGHLIAAARQICSQLDGLLPLIRSREEWKPIVDSAERLRNDWSRIKSEWPEAQSLWPLDLEERFTSLWNAVTEEAGARAAYADEIERKQEYARARLVKAAEALTAAQQFMGEFAHGLVAETESVARLEELESQLRALLQDLGNDSDPDAAGLCARLREALDAAVRLSSEQKQMSEVMERQSVWRKRAQALLNQENYVSKDELRKLEKTLGGDGKYYIAALREGHAANEALLAQLRERHTKDEAARKDAVRMFKTSVATFAAALENGRVAEATALQKQLQGLADWFTPSDVTALKRNGALQEFQRTTAQLRELKDRQGWGSLPAREELCTRARGLLAQAQAHVEDPQFDWDQAAKAIRELRQSWKELGPTEGREAKELWETFNEVCNQAYDCCQRNFGVRADERAENLAKRTELVHQMVEYHREHIEGRPHDLVDYKALDQFIRRCEQEWRALGPVDRSKFRAVRDEFHDAIAKLRDAITQERARCSEQKEALIKRAEKLGKSLASEEAVDSESIQRAVETMKQLQDQWKQIGRAADEKGTWERFRAAADLVFAKRQEQFDLQNKERLASIEAREKLCTQVEEASLLEGDSLKRANAEVEAAKAQWEALPAIPKERDRLLRRRFSDALSRFNARLSGQVDEGRRMAGIRAEARAQCCDELEKLLDDAITGGAGAAWKSECDALESKWATLIANTAKNDPVVQRYHSLHDQLEQYLAADAHQREQLRVAREAVRLANLKRKEELCMRMEILAQIDSPEEVKQARLAYQVHQLAEHMAQGGAGAKARGTLREHQVNDILLKWWSTGAVPGELQERLQQRFLSARKAFEQSTTVPSKGQRLEA